MENRRKRWARWRIEEDENGNLIAIEQDPPPFTRQEWDDMIATLKDLRRRCGMSKGD